MDLKVKLLRPGAIPPRQALEGDAGYDLHTLGDHTIGPGQGMDIPTGIAVELPPGTFARIEPRSSTLRSRGLRTNLGVIDNGYRGELFAYVTNENADYHTIHHGDRLVQLILAPLHSHPVVVVDDLAPSQRGANGFGSTGRAEHEVPAGWKEVPGYVRPPLLYLGGPIDSLAPDEDPDDRHKALLMEWLGGVATLPPMIRDGFREPGDVPIIWCPVCGVRESGGIEWAMKNNMEALAKSEWAVFEWTGELSFGTPVEIWLVAQRIPGRVLVVGQMPPGLFRDHLLVAGVREVATIPDAVRIMKAER